MAGRSLTQSLCVPQETRHYWSAEYFLNTRATDFSE
jgi:hypothetical protein